jgi:predicted AlkP superfamily pyrophosphatase or phosphodiesterase
VTRRLHPILVAIALALALAVAASAAAQHAARPILILVSFDGFRWDYLDRGVSPNLNALAAQGVRAKGLIPSFPSLTFPNHYTIVTGLYPDHHGIVANEMEESGYPRFTMASLTARDGHWWGGQPIWVTAMLQGLRAGATFWPGSEAPIDGIRPTYWTAFDDEMPNVDRVNHTLDLLALPESERPSFLTVYFSETDHVGHDDGPDSPEMPEAIRHVDAALGLLEAGVRQLHLSGRTSLVVVSDHGMTPLSDERVIFLDDYIDLSRVHVVNWGETLELRPAAGSSVDEVYRALVGKHPALAVYKKADLPARLHYGTNPRVPPIVGLASEGWEVTSHARWTDDLARQRKRGGAHGYDPALTSMHGLFVAEGPGIRRGVVAPEFQNIHIYDFLCAVLGLTPAPNDGSPAVTRGFLIH